ncbi:unnamed protein product [Protopolystoma xenopodis]|uniref:Uncharacterized protein n=1 Tax=Protopolystoma xenopodis TaxID=117903 RepID=A0A3S5A1T9_9PLAT|nr:unnamed protein product [Protopolystoma xenopodis]
MPIRYRVCRVARKRRYLLIRGLCRSWSSEGESEVDQWTSEAVAKVADVTLGLPCCLSESLQSSNSFGLGPVYRWTLLIVQRLEQHEAWWAVLCGLLGAPVHPSVRNHHQSLLGRENIQSNADLSAGKGGLTDWQPKTTGIADALVFSTLGRMQFA